METKEQRNERIEKRLNAAYTEMVAAITEAYAVHFDELYESGDATADEVNDYFSLEGVIEDTTYGCEWADVFSGDDGEMAARMLAEAKSAWFEAHDSTP